LFDLTVVLIKRLFNFSSGGIKLITLLKMVGKCWELVFDVLVGRIGAVVHTNINNCGIRYLGFFPAKQRHQLREMQKRIQYRFFDITYKVKTLGIQSPCQRMIWESRLRNY